MVVIYICNCLIINPIVKYSSYKNQTCQLNKVIEAEDLRIMLSPSNLIVRHKEAKPKHKHQKSKPLFHSQLQLVRKMKNLKNSSCRIRMKRIKRMKNQSKITH